MTDAPKPPRPPDSPEEPAGRPSPGVQTLLRALATLLVHLLLALCCGGL